MSTPKPILDSRFLETIRRALEEDIGSGDLTALLTPPKHPASGSVISREDAVVAGTAWFDACFHLLDTDARIDWTVRCSEPLAGDVGDGPDGQVCTNVAISGCTEPGKRFAEYGDCDVVRTRSGAQL